MPIEAVNYLQQGRVNGPILSPDYWGGYLIYRLNPHNKVVIDDRHDLYGEQFLRLYLKMIHLEPGWDEFLKLHGVSCLLLPRNAALATVMSQTSGWKPIYSDDVAIVFMKTGPNLQDADQLPSR
jgi:hypothetical protein